VSQLSQSGVVTSVYCVSISGFDTHINQLGATGATATPIRRICWRVHGRFENGGAAKRRDADDVFGVWPAREAERQQRHRSRHSQQRVSDWWGNAGAARYE